MFLEHEISFEVPQKNFVINFAEFLLENKKRNKLDDVIISLKRKSGSKGSQDYFLGRLHSGVILCKMMIFLLNSLDSNQSDS
jgi:hypothetical protein